MTSGMRGMGSDLIDISAEIKGETEKAFRLFDGTTTEWVPKSQVEDNGDGTFAMPEWLAKDKGFL
jgi:hypothetical protein